MVHCADNVYNQDTSNRLQVVERPSDLYTGPLRPDSIGGRLGTTSQRRATEGNNADTTARGQWRARLPDPGLADGHPLVLAGDGDLGGLIGIHLREEMQIENAIVSVDGLELKEFDYIDIGTMLPNSGAVPVVIKSLIFPASAAPGMEWQPAPRAVTG